MVTPLPPPPTPNFFFWLRACEMRFRLPHITVHHRQQLPSTQILDELCAWRDLEGLVTYTHLGLKRSKPTLLGEGRRLLAAGERLVKWVLRTNEDLTCNAHNLPMERVRREQARMVSWVLFN